MHQPTRSESLRSLLLALTFALIVLIAIYMAVEQSQVWADRPEDGDAPGAIMSSDNVIAPQFSS